MKVRCQRLRIAALLIAPALLFAACGDDDSESAATTGAGTTGGAATTAGAGTTAAAASGEPVNVMVMGSFTGPFDTSFAFDTAEAAAQAINDAGGVQGRPLTILTCDDKFDPNATLDCARQAADADAVAIISGLVLAGDYLDFAAQEGIPVIPAVGFQSAEFQNDISFPITAGGAGLATAAIAEVLAQGVTVISLVYDESSGVAKPAAEAAAAGLAEQGINVANVIPMPLDIADASSILAAAEAGGAEGVALLVQGSQAAKFITAADQAGSTLIIGSYDLSLEPATIETLGPAADGVLMASSFRPLTDTSNPGVEQFFDEMAAYDPTITVDDWSIPGVGLGTYAATHLVGEAAAAAATVDAAGVLAALAKLTDFDIGIMAPIDFSAPNTTFIPTFTRVFNTSYFFSEIQNTELVPLSDEPVNVATVQ